MEKLRTTVIQSSIFWQDISKNLEQFQKKIENISTETDMIILPEMFTTGFTMEPSKFAENREGKAVTWMKKMSESKNSLIIGSIIIEENGKYFNRLFAVHPDGKADMYDKRHLFAMAGENKNYSGGTELLTVEFKSWRIRPLICYDLRFPVWSRNHDNYDLLVYIANWPTMRSFHWKTLLQARAIENQAFVAGVNRVGNDGNQIPHSGDSMVYDPMGNLLTTFQPNEEKSETVILEKEQLVKIRKTLPFISDRDHFSILKN